MWTCHANLIVRPGLLKICQKTTPTINLLNPYIVQIATAKIGLQIILMSISVVHLMYNVDLIYSGRYCENIS